MTAPGLLCACVLAATPSESGESDETQEGGRRPARDLFGTARRKAGDRPGEPSRVWGTVELSDGTRLQGWLSLTPGRPLEVFDLDAQEWREFAIHEIRGLRAAPRREELEREWRWKEYGKDEKVYTGRAYPKRWLDHELVLRPDTGKDGGEKDEKDGKGGERIRCHIKGAVLHLTTEPDRAAVDKTDFGELSRAASEKTRPGERPATEITENTEGERQRKARLSVGGQAEPLPSETSVSSVASRRRGDEAPKRFRFILRQYERGRLGQTLDELVYVKRVIVHEKVPSPKPAAGNGKRPAAE